MADLSKLGGLNPVEPVDLNDYPVQSKPSFQLPPKGRYQLQAPDSFPAEAFGRSQRSKALTIQIDPTIVDGPFTGFTIKRQRISAATWERDGKRVSQVGNYLTAHGVKAVLADEQAIADAVESTAGGVYTGDLDWRAARNGFEVKGMENFPKLADGTYQSWVTHPTEKDENGNPTRVLAYLDIVRFVPRS